MYLLLAIFWFVAGVGLIIYDNYTGDSAWVIRGLGWSPGWLMLLLSLYNFVRWWSRRQGRRNLDAEYRAHLNYRRQPPPVRREPPDANFNFNDEPAPELKDQPPAGQ